MPGLLLFLPFFPHKEFFFLALAQRRDGGGPVLAGDVLDLDYDAEARTLRFLRDGQVLGEHTDVAADAKLVVSMAHKGNALMLL